MTQQKNLKKALSLSLAVNLEKVIWNWMEKHHDEFASLASKPNDELAGRIDNRSQLVSELEFSHYAIVHAPPLPLHT